MSGENGSVLPNGWTWASLGEVTEDVVEQSGPEDDGDFTYIDIGSVDNSLKVIVSPKALSVTDAPSRAKQRLLAGDVLVSMTRPNLNAVAKVQDSLDGAIGSTGFHVLRTFWVEPSWLYYAVQTHSFIDAMCQVVQGALYPAVRPKDVRSFSIPVPPAAEQTRIADALDELLSDLDAGVSALERVRAKLKLYRASVLKAAVEGALTADWRVEHPGTEPASELLQRILLERRRRWEEDQLRKYQEKGKPPPKDWKAKYKEPAAPDTTGLPELPEGWAITSMDSLLHHLTSGSRDWQQFYGAGTGTFVMAQNVRPYRLDMSNRQTIDPPKDDPSCERSQIEEHDLLVTIVGANTGDLCRVDKTLNEHYVCQSVALMRPVSSNVSKYLALYGASPSGAQLHYARYIYGAGRPHLSFDQLRHTPVLLPPLREQDLMIDIVDDQLSIIDHLESDLDAKFQSAQALRQSILRHAFTGKLVPQDPNDEPASELLKRIAAEREARAPPDQDNHQAQDKPMKLNAIAKREGERTREPVGTYASLNDEHIHQHAQIPTNRAWGDPINAWRKPCINRLAGTLALPGRMARSNRLAGTLALPGCG